MIGIDFSYGGFAMTAEKSSQGPIAIAGEQQNHFIRGYYQPGDTMNAPKLDLQRRAFVKARSVFEADGRKILNASRQTALDVIERVSFDEIFP